MNKMGAVYKDMLKVLFEVSSKNMQEEAQKLADLGVQAGKMLRIALSFDIFTDRLRFIEDDGSGDEPDFAE